MTPIEYRAAACLSRDEVAERAGVSPGTLGTWETGMLFRPYDIRVIRNAHRVAKVLGCAPIEYLRSIAARAGRPDQPQDARCADER